MTSMARVTLPDKDRQHHVGTTPATMGITKLLARFHRQVRHERIIENWREASVFVKPSKRRRTFSGVGAR